MHSEASYMRNMLSLGFLVAASITGIGCSDPIMAVDQSVDCNDICSRYRDCYNSAYDVSACRSRCENYVHGDGGHGDQANQCDMCVDPQSCSTVAFACGTQCAGIVP